MEYDLRSTLATLLPSSDDQRLADTMRAAVQPFIYDAFRRGLELGVALARESAAKELNVARGEIAKAFGQRPPRQVSQNQPAGSLGNIVKVIDLVLADTPGLRAKEVEDRVAEIRPTINGGSVGNELRKQEGTRYARDNDKRWFLIGAPITIDDATVAPTDVTDPTPMVSA